MYPKFPPAAGESVISWVNRFGRFHCGLDLSSFLTIIRASQEDVLRGKTDFLDRMAKISGITVDKLKTGICEQVAERQYCYQRENFNCEFIHLNIVKFCPACLLENIDNGELGIFKFQWSFNPIRTCGVHDIPLVKERSTKPFEVFKNLSRLAIDIGDFAKIWQASTRRKPSDLQNYVAARLGGLEGPSWLDAQQIDIACRVTEVLGACIEFGPNVVLGNMSENDWDTAGHIGFGFTSRGEDGIRNGLDLLLASLNGRSSQSGAKAAFGHFYEWVRAQKKKKSVGPVRDVLREYILDTFPVQAGSMLLGEEVDQARRHSITTLAAKFDVHTETVKTVLLRARMLTQKHSDNDTLITFPAGPSEELFAKLVRAIPVAKIPQYIGCTSSQAINLVEGGFLTSVISDPDDGSSGRHKGVDAHDIDQFMEKMRKRGEHVLVPGRGMGTIGEVASSSRVPSTKVVSLLLDNQLDIIELLPAELKFQSVLVNKKEVLSKAGIRTGSEGLTISKASRELGVSYETVCFLLEATDLVGEQVLESCGQVRHMGLMRDIVDPGSVQKFKERYRTLFMIGGSNRKRADRLRSKLADKGIKPAWPPDVAGAEFYRVCDI